MHAKCNDKDMAYVHAKCNDKDMSWNSRSPKNGKPSHIVVVRNKVTRCSYGVDDF